MKPSKIVLVIAVIVVLLLALIDRYRTNQQINALLAKQPQTPQDCRDDESQAGTAAPVDLKETLIQLDQARAALAAVTTKLANLSAKIADLESMVDNLRNERALANNVALNSSDPPTTPQPRAWGPEQVVGPPDTHQAGDIQTAWASRQPDAGEDWLNSDSPSRWTFSFVSCGHRSHPKKL